MKYAKNNKTSRASLSFLSVILAMYLAGCTPGEGGEGIEGGGMEGTGTGPTINTYQLRNLPERISPDIPKNLFRGEELKPSQSEDPNGSENTKTFSSRMDEFDLSKSEGWSRMNDDLYWSGVVRVSAQSNAMILDIAFEDIQKRCMNQPVDCTIPADQIKVTLTQEAINRLIEIATDWVESIPPAFLEEEKEDLVPTELVKEQVTLLLDSEIVFGETRYSRLDGAPYSHSVQTFLKHGEKPTDFTLLFWEDAEFNARWHDDGTVAKFFTNADAADFPILEYFYQNNTPSELAIATTLYDFEGEELSELRADTFIKLIANDRNNAGVLIDGAQVIIENSGLIGFGDESFDHLSYDLFRAQMDNGGGYSTYDRVLFNVSSIPKAVVSFGFRDSFDNVGNLTASSQCDVRADFVQQIEICDDEDFLPNGPAGSSIIDSPYFFQPQDFDSLVAVQDAIQWTVQGLPDEVKTIAVVSADPAIELSRRDVLCRGYHFVGDDTRMFCSATDEQLNNTVVLELVEGEPGPVIPTATLVQIQ